MGRFCSAVRASAPARASQPPPPRAARPAPPATPARARRRARPAARGAARRRRARATLVARTGCSLVGTMKRAIDSIQAASRSAGLREARRGRLLRRAHQDHALEAQRRHGLLVQAGEAALERLGQAALRVRLHDGQRAHAAGAQPARERRQLLGRGRPQRALAVVVEPRRIEQDQRRRRPRRSGHCAIGRAGTSTVSTPRRPSRIGSRASTRVWAIAMRAGQAPHQLVAQRAGGAGDQQRARRAGARARGARGSRPAGLEEGRRAIASMLPSRTSHWRTPT